MPKLLFYSFLLTCYLGVAFDVKSLDPTSTEIEVIRKKVTRSPKTAQPKENIQQQAAKPPSPPVGTSDFTRKSGSSWPFRAQCQDELVMFEIPEIESSVNQEPPVDSEKLEQNRRGDTSVALVPEPTVAAVTTPPPALEVRDEVPINLLLLPPAASLEVKSPSPVNAPEQDSLGLSVQPQISIDVPPTQPVEAASVVVSQKLVVEEAPPLTSQAISLDGSVEVAPLPQLPLESSLTAPPGIFQKVSEQQCLPLVLPQKQYKELELEPLIFRLRQSPCFASDLTGSISLPISFYFLSLQEGFLHPGAKSWNFTAGLKFRFQVLPYDAYTGVYPAKQPERGALRNKAGVELENWQTQFLKECAPYKEARRALSEKEERVKRKQAAVDHFQNPQTKPEQFQKAHEDLSKAKEDLRVAEGVFSAIQEKLLLKYYRLFLHHHEKFIPDHLHEQAMKALAYLISVYPLKLNKPFEPPQRKPIKAFTLPASEIDRHILMLTYRIEDMKREQGIFRDVKSYYELVFKPSVQNWDWRALKNWSMLKVADPNSNPLIRAQKALSESAKTPSYARYPRKTDEANMVLALMGKDALGEKLEKNYFSKIKPFQELVLTAEQEARLLACSFPGIYRGQDEIVSYTGRAITKTEGKEGNSRSFGGVWTEFYKVNARRHLPPDLEPLNFLSLEDDSSEKKRLIPIPFVVPKGVVMVGDTISFDSINYPFEKQTFVAGDAASLEAMSFHRLLWPEVMEELEKRRASKRKVIDEIAVHNESYKASDDEVDQMSFYDSNQLRDYDPLFKEYLELLKTQRQLLEELHRGYDAYSLVPYPFQLFQYNRPKSQNETLPLSSSLTLNKKGVEDRHLLKKRLVDGKLWNILSVYESVNLSENRLTNPAPFVGFRFLRSLDLSHNSLEGLRFITPQLPHLVYLNLAFNYISSLSAFVDIFEEEKGELDRKFEREKAQISEEYRNELRGLDSSFVELTKKQAEEFEAKRKAALEKYEVKKRAFEEELDRKKKEVGVAAENDQTEDDLMQAVKRRDEELKKHEDFYQRLLSKLEEEHTSALDLLRAQNEAVLLQIAEEMKLSKIRLEEKISQKYKQLEEEGAAEKDSLMRSRETKANTTLRTLNLSHNRIRNQLALLGDVSTTSLTSLPQLSKVLPLKIQTGGIECLGRFQALTSLNLSGNINIGTLKLLSFNTNLEELDASGCGLVGDLDSILPRTLKKLESLDLNGQLHLTYNFDQACGEQSSVDVQANDEKFNKRFPALKVLKAERRILKREGEKPILLSELSKQLAPSS